MQTLSGLTVITPISVSQWTTDLKSAVPCSATLAKGGRVWPGAMPVCMLFFSSEIMGL